MMSITIWLYMHLAAHKLRFALKLSGKNIRIAEIHRMLLGQLHLY